MRPLLCHPLATGVFETWDAVRKTAGILEMKGSPAAAAVAAALLRRRHARRKLRLPRGALLLGCRAVDSQLLTVQRVRRGHHLRGMRSKHQGQQSHANGLGSQSHAGLPSPQAPEDQISQACNVTRCSGLPKSFHDCEEP